MVRFKGFWLVGSGVEIGTHYGAICGLVDVGQWIETGNRAGMEWCGISAIVDSACMVRAVRVLFFFELMGLGLRWGGRFCFIHPTLPALFNPNRRTHLHSLLSALAGSMALRDTSQTSGMSGLPRVRHGH